MNTKTNLEYASNSYNGGIMGSDSPAALLDMLAEVASQTLHSEKKRTKSLLASQYKPKAEFVKRKTQEQSFNVPQLLSLPASQLVKQFSIFTSDELKRQYSYTCALIIGCGQKYTSFASEGRARMSIKAHLAEHLEYLKTNKEAYNTFTTKSVNFKSYKSNPQNKKNRLQQSKKPQETLNKENKNVILEKSTNYLRNILLNDVNFKELEKHKSIEKIENPKKVHSSEQKDMERIDFKVLGDHSYFERRKDEMPNGRESGSINNVFDTTVVNENIVFMVVGADSVHMKEYSHVNQELSENINQGLSPVYLPEVPWSDEGCTKSIDVTTTTKPKGKAKFIGTSKEEREMALAFMDRIKKKGNPTGNNLECRICNPPRSFTAPTTLVSHYRSHAGIKPYECRICRAVFTRRHSLKYHMLIHQNQTRFTCADCGKKFRHPSHFREHRRRHTGEAPFGCDDCGQRFKTRNTYKRHLKTRHGKVLTTTGELLYLSEEDFQKVRTNRKKRNDVNEEHLMDEHTVAPKAIMNYQDDKDLQQITTDTTEEYIMSHDLNDGDRNTLQLIKNCFETYDVCLESHAIKTETIETEIPIHRIAYKNEASMDEKEVEKMQDNLPELQRASYNHLNVVEDACDQIICQDNAEGQTNIIYNDINDSSSYVKVQYGNEENTVEDGSNVIEYQEDDNLVDSQIEANVQLLHSSEDGYCNSVLSDDINEKKIEYVKNEIEEHAESIEINTHNSGRTEKLSEHIVISQGTATYNETNDRIEVFGNTSTQADETHEFAISTNVESSAENEDISHQTNHITESGLLQTHNIVQHQGGINLLSKSKDSNNYQSIVAGLIKDRAIVPQNNVSGKNRKHSVRQNKQHLYVHTESITGIMVQNKCINILPCQLSNCYEQQNKSKQHLSKNRKFAILNRPTQTVNLKQSGKQSAILLLTNETVKNSIFRIDQNSTAISGVKK